MKNRINISFIIIGIFTIIAFALLLRFTYVLRDIRINGEIKLCPIVNINYAIKGGNHANIEIEGNVLPAGRLIDELKVGDSIAVRYIKGNSWVVQDSVEIWRYYLYFGLESILLILGIILIIGGLMGKKVYNSNIPYNNLKKNIISSHKK